MTVDRTPAPPADRWMLPREHGAYALVIAPLLALAEVVRQALGHPSAETRGRNLSGSVASTALRIAGASEPLGMSLALAVGQAHGQKLFGRGRATLVLFGEGVTTSGMFHESLALALAHDVPLVFVCKSQLWPEGAPAEAASTETAPARDDKGGRRERFEGKGRDNERRRDKSGGGERKERDRGREQHLGTIREAYGPAHAGQREHAREEEEGAQERHRPGDHQRRDQGPAAEVAVTHELWPQDARRHTQDCRHQHAQTAADAQEPAGTPGDRQIAPEPVERHAGEHQAERIGLEQYPGRKAPPFAPPHSFRPQRHPGKQREPAALAHRRDHGQDKDGDNQRPNL